MCEANAYLRKGKEEELLIEAVDKLIPIEGEVIKLINIFGQQKVLKARIVELALVDHRIILEEISE